MANYFNQGILAEREEYVRLFRSAAFHPKTIPFLFYQTAYLNEEVKSTEPALSIRVPRFNHHILT
jgi:hypothetical protein